MRNMTEESETKRAFSRSGSSPPDELIDVNEAARRLAVKPATIRSWVLQRLIPYVKLGRCVRLKASEIERMISDGTVERRI